jgi:hypothetical protein
MPNPTATSSTDLPSALTIALCALSAGLGHVGRMLYENKAVPIRKVVGAQILTLCVGVATGSLVQAYLNPSPLVVLPACLLVGYVGGPAVLALAARWAKAEAVKRTGTTTQRTQDEEDA